MIAFWASIALSFAVSQAEFAIDKKNALTIFSYNYAPHRPAAVALAAANGLLAVVTLVLAGALAARWFQRRRKG